MKFLLWFMALGALCTGGFLGLQENRLFKAEQRLEELHAQLGFQQRNLQTLQSLAAPDSEALRTLRMEHEKAKALQALLDQPLPDDGLDHFRKEDPASAVRLPPSFRPCSELVNAGRNTPINLGMTLLSGIRDADIARVSNCLSLTTPIRSELQPLVDAMRAQGNSEINTAEDLVASYLTAMYGRLVGNQTEVTSFRGKPHLRSSLMLSTGKIVRIDFPLVDDQGDWRVLVPTGLVRFIKEDNAERAKPEVRIEPPAERP